jgi:hypothetical protein
MTSINPLQPTGAAIPSLPSRRSNGRPRRLNSAFGGNRSERSPSAIVYTDVGRARIHLPVIRRLIMALCSRLVPLIALVVTSAPAGSFADPRGEKPDRKKGPDEVAWGKAADGLEAGIGFRPGEEHACRVGGSVTFYVYLRNVSDKPVSLSHIEPLFDEFLPTVEDGAGRKLRVVPGPMNLGLVSIVSRSLEPGETIRLAPCWFLVREPGLRGEAVAPTLVAKPGKYQVYHSGFPTRRKGDTSDKYSGPTGRVEFEIKGSPDAKP